MCVSRNRDGITVTLRANCLNQFSALCTFTERRLTPSRRAPISLSRSDDEKMFLFTLNLIRSHCFRCPKKQSDCSPQHMVLLRALHSPLPSLCSGTR